MSEAPRGRAEPPDRGEVEAWLAARDELGPAYEPELVDALAERIEAAVESRVARQREVSERERVENEARSSRQMVLGIVSLGTGIPITAIAGGVGDGLAGVVVAWAGIVGVNVAHALQGRGHRP